MTALTQRVVLATDVALPAGTNNIGDVDVLSVIPGTAATNLGKAEDDAHTSGDTGVMALAVYKDPEAQVAGTAGDYTPLITDASGRLYANSQGNQLYLTKQGRMYNATTSDINLSTSGVKLFAFKSSATKNITIRSVLCSAAAAAAFDFYLTPTVSVAGTNLTMNNMAIGGGAATADVEKSPTTTANGTAYLGTVKTAAAGVVYFEFNNDMPILYIPAETATYRLLVIGTSLSGTPAGQITAFWSEE